MRVTVKTTYNRESVSRRILSAKRVSYRPLVLIWKEASRAFVRATVKSMRVETGMSRASLIPLSKEIGMVSEVKGLINRRKTHVDGAYDITGTWRKNRVRHMGAGVLSNRKKAGYDFSVGTASKPAFVFKFEATVWQHLVGERGLSGDKAWKSIESGRLAFREVLNNPRRSTTLKILKLESWLTGK